MTDLTKFTAPNRLKTAVLFLVFNRLDTTRQVFQSIREARPPRLYIASDGARVDHEGDAQNVSAVRDYIIKNIDWECEIRILFRDENLGCKYAVSGAISWFFDNEEEGIILEDDCLPAQSFFWFCEELLERYRHNFGVGIVSGDNFQNGINRGDADYYFSVYPHIWGWASWASRWKNYDVTLVDFSDTKFIDNNFSKRSDVNFWKDRFKEVKNNQIDTWDYQLVFALWKHQQLTIIPRLNLVSNIGFGEGATHTVSESELSEIKVHDFILLKHPEKIQRNMHADEFTAKLQFRSASAFIRYLNKFVHLVKTKISYFTS